MRIPNSRPYWTGQEIRNVSAALASQQISGDGAYTEKVALYLQQTFQAKEVLMTTSGTHALEMAVRLIGLESGDEVILPSFTFSSTACAVMLSGGKPVFAEVCRDTLNIDPDDIQLKITPKTRAIICVHYAGTCCDMDRILALAKQHNLSVIEDAAQAVNAKYKGRYAGTLGDFGCYSFHGTKNYVCGEGGALLINTEQEGVVRQAEILRQKGTNRQQFLRGEVDTYTWVALGSSYSPSDLLMAVLLAQLSAREEIQQKRKQIYQYYTDNLQEFIRKGILGILRQPPDCESNNHLFAILLPTEQKRDQVLQSLRERGVEATIHFIPLHSSPMGRELGCLPEDLPITEQVSRCLLRLPMYAGLTEEELEYVIKQLKEALSEK